MHQGNVGDGRRASGKDGGKRMNAELVKAAVTFTADLLGGYLYKKSLTTHVIAEISHHELARIFLSNIHNPSVMYAFTPLPVTQSIEAAHAFMANANATPETLPGTADGWSVSAAVRSSLTLREHLRLTMSPDFHPHLLLMMLKESEGGSHVFAGCRYTDHSKYNFRNFFGKAAFERAYRLLISTRVQAPITAVTADNIASLP